MREPVQLVSRAAQVQILQDCARVEVRLLLLQGPVLAGCTLTVHDHHFIEFDVDFLAVDAPEREGR